MNTINAAKTYDDWIEVPWHNGFGPEILEWCRQNFKVREWDTDWYMFKFRHHEDALWFLMRWG